MNAKAVLLVAGAVAALWLPQDPVKRPKPPENAPPLPPVQEPFRTEVERRDLLQQFGAKSPIEGFYELVAASRPDMPAVLATGYLSIGRRHLSFHLEAETPDGDPVRQSAFRSYRLVGSRLHMTSLTGFRLDPDGTTRIEPSGVAVQAEYLLLGTKLQLDLIDGSRLEFQRLE